MMCSYEKIIVCCPGSLVTGGPELLHQLVHALCHFGHNAYISYYPFDTKFECPPPYQKYHVPSTSFVNDPNVFYIVPETATWVLKKIGHKNAAVWWLSVDNYFPKEHISWFIDFYNSSKNLLKGKRISLRCLSGYKHYVQSEYANKFIRKLGYSSSPLSDYLSLEHLQSRTREIQRRDIVLFNPKKGRKKTALLQRKNPDIKFIPIENMTAEQVSNLLVSAKVYIDFGYHPGKDRMPREAVIAGCCVITGRQGSANFYEDIPIQKQYKLDDSTDLFVRYFRPLILSIFNNFSQHRNDFNQYREVISKEKETFLCQVENIFGIKQRK